MPVLCQHRAREQHHFDLQTLSCQCSGACGNLAHRPEEAPSDFRFDEGRCWLASAALQPQGAAFGSVARAAPSGTELCGREGSGRFRGRCDSSFGGF